MTAQDQAITSAPLNTQVSQGVHTHKSETNAVHTFAKNIIDDALVSSRLDDLCQSPSLQKMQSLYTVLEVTHTDKISTYENLCLLMFAFTVSPKAGNVTQDTIRLYALVNLLRALRAANTSFGFRKTVVCRQGTALDDEYLLTISKYIIDQEVDEDGDILAQFLTDLSFQAQDDTETLYKAGARLIKAVRPYTFHRQTPHFSEGDAKHRRLERDISSDTKEEAKKNLLKSTLSLTIYSKPKHKKLRSYTLSRGFALGFGGLVTASLSLAVSAILATTNTSIFASLALGVLGSALGLAIYSYGIQSVNDALQQR